MSLIVVENQKGHQSGIWTIALVFAALVVGLIIQDQVFSLTGLASYRAQDGDSGMSQLCYYCVDDTLTEQWLETADCTTVEPAGHWTSDQFAKCCSSCQNGVVDTKPYSTVGACADVDPVTYKYDTAFMKVPHPCYGCDPTIGDHIDDQEAVLCPGELCADDDIIKLTYPYESDPEICCVDHGELTPVLKDCGYCDDTTGITDPAVKVCPQAQYGCKTQADDTVKREPFPQTESNWYNRDNVLFYTNEFCTFDICRHGHTNSPKPVPLKETTGAATPKGEIPPPENGDFWARRTENMQCVDLDCYGCWGTFTWAQDTTLNVWGKQGTASCPAQYAGTQDATFRCRDDPPSGSSRSGGWLYTKIGDIYEPIDPDDPTGGWISTGHAPNTVTASTSDGYYAYLTGRVSKNGLIPNDRLIVAGSPHNENGSSAYAAKYNHNGSIAWVFYFNGSIDDQGSAIWYEGDNVYVIGTTGAFNTTLNFTPVGNAYQTFKPGYEDAFIAKLDINGNILWSTYFGTAGKDRGEGIAVDANGSIYVAGHTDSSSFPIAGTPAQGSNAGKNDSFVAKFNSTGSLVWSTYFGGTDDDIIHGGGLSVDSDGNVLLTGSTLSSDFPVTSGSPQGGQDAFLVKFNKDGVVQWSKYVGGSGKDAGRQARTDINDNIFVVGDTESSNFPTASAEQPSFGGGVSDIFLSKYSPSGTLLMSTFVGGAGNENGGSLGVSFIGNVYLAGITTSSGLDTPDANLTYQGYTDGLVRKYDNGGVLKHSTYMGGSGHDRALSIYVDWHEQVMVVGDTNSTDFAVMKDEPQTLVNPQGDGFMATYDFYPAPAMATFNKTLSTEFIPTKVPDLRVAEDVTLYKDGGKVIWTSPVRAALQNYDDNILLANNFISLQTANLDPTYDAPADVTFTGINCESFRLYYATGFYDNAEDLSAAGILVAGPGQVGGDCTDPTICTNLQCADGSLTFTAMHFDGFAEGEEGYNVPEFGTWALLITVCLTIGGLLYQRSRPLKRS